MATQTPASTKLRAMLADPDKILTCPGVYDGFTARIALSVGFDCLYMTGAGTSMSRLGMADLGLATMEDMVSNAGMIASLDPSIPLIADADTGYGASINVGRTVQKLIQAGVAGFHLEDQVVSKKCGHLAGKQLVSTEEYLTRIRAAVNMRRQMCSDIVIIARTDALQSLGFDEALARLKAAVAVGADVAFLEAIRTKEEAVKVCEAFRESEIPTMYGMVQGSSAPHLTVAQAQEIGFQIIIYAASCLLPTFLSVRQSLEHLKREGDYQPFGTKIAPHEVFDVCGMRDLVEFDRLAASGESS